MNDDLKKQALLKYIKERSGWSDQNLMDDFKNSRRLDQDIIESIQNQAPIDEADYSDYSIKRKYTPEQEALIDSVRNKQFERMQQAEAALNERGYEKYKKRGTKAFGVDSFAFKNPATGKVLRQFAGALPIVGGLAAAGISEDASAAIPVLDQAESVGMPVEEERQMFAERDAQVNYDNSQARRDALKKISGR